MAIPALSDFTPIEEGEVNLKQALDGLLPSQIEGLQATEPYVCGSGGFGSGKTVWLAVAATLAGMDSPNGFSLIGRLHKPSLKISTQKTFLEIFPRAWMKSWVPSQDPAILTAINGHQYIFSHLDMNDVTVDHVLSTNLSGFYLDQAEEMPDKSFLTLIGRMRRKNALAHMGRLVANPKGSDYIWKMFFDPTRPFQIRKKFRGIFFDSRDNVHLREGYIEDMMSIYPDDWKERFIYGSFADFTGKVYKDWNSNLHTWDCSEGHFVFRDANGDPQPHPPKSWPVIVGIDIGGGVDPWSFVFIAVQPETGFLYQFAEIHAQGILIRDFADKYFEIMQDRILEGAAYDWENQAAAIEMAGEGIVASRANKDVTAGTFKTGQYLHADPRVNHPFTDNLGSPRYFVCRNCCPSTCRSLANLSYKKDRAGNDTGEIKHDEFSHDAAAVRYAIHTFRPEPTRVKPAETWENPALDPMSRQYWREVAQMKKRGYYDPHERYPEDDKRRRSFSKWRVPTSQSWRLR